MKRGCSGIGLSNLFLFFRRYDLELNRHDSDYFYNGNASISSDLESAVLLQLNLKAILI